MGRVNIKPYELEMAVKEFDKVTDRLGKLSEQLNFVRGCLTPFSGFGISGVISAIDRTDDRLDSYCGDLIAERDALRKIINTVTACDREVSGIFRATEIEKIIPNTIVGISAISGLKSLAEWYSKFFDSIAGDMDLIDFIDFTDKSFSLIQAINNQPDSPPIWPAIKYGYDIMAFYRSGGYKNPQWLADGLSITKDTFSLSKDVLKLFDSLGLIKNENLVENVSPIFTWTKIALSTVVKGVKSYNENNADGVITSDEKWDIVFDTETAALSAVTAAFLTTLHPAAGAAYAYADGMFDFSGKLSDAIQSWGNSEAEKIRDTLNNSGEFTDFYRKQNSFNQVLIRFTMTDVRYRAIVNHIYK